MSSCDFSTVYTMMWEALNSAALWQVFWAVFPVWIFGAVVGLLLPRPKWLSGGTRTGALLLTPPGTGLRRLALAFHGAVILREVWYYFTCPGTFRKLSLAVWDWARGRGFYFEWPAKAADAEQLVLKQSNTPSSSWYVDSTDMQFFKERAEQDAIVPGASEWECVLQKDIPNFVRYQAWRRTLKNGKTEYKSVTISPDASAEEFMDMYFDDEFRPKWDTMITHHEVLEHGDFSQRQQVVRWIRSFPFAFLSDREYVIARRLFKEGGKLYGITKALNNHPRAPNTKTVKMDVFYSMWSSENVECPWGSGKPACQTVLLHHEEFKIPENLARFAARHGMWGFVRKLASTVPEWVALRRSRCATYDTDMQAYGAGFKPNPPGMRRSPSTMSSASWTTDSSSLSSASSVCSEDVSERDATDARPRRRVRSLVALALAGTVAVALNRKVSSVHGHRRRHHAHRTHSHRSREVTSHEVLDHEEL